MEDLISRKAAIEWFFRPYSNEESYSNLDVERALNAIPAVDAVPVVHGRWIYKERHRKSYRQYTGFDDAGETHTIMVLEESDGKEPYCSECGAQAAESFLDYCPNCGARMDGEGE